jgi:hypothetical protein
MGNTSWRNNKHAPLACIFASGELPDGVWGFGHLFEQNCELLSYACLSRLLSSCSSHIDKQITMSNRHLWASSCLPTYHSWQWWKSRLPSTKIDYKEIKENVICKRGLLSTPSVSKQKLRYTKPVGLRSIFAFLARNCVRCIALTKRFPVS